MQNKLIFNSDIKNILLGIALMTMLVFSLLPVLAYAQDTGTGTTTDGGTGGILDGTTTTTTPGVPSTGIMDQGTSTTNLIILGASLVIIAIALGYLLRSTS